jgi:6-phosphogluconolactonase (cycloisomerase 2 family)
MKVGDSPTGLAIDPLGQYLYFVTMEVNTGKPTAINGYSIDATTGALTAIVGMPLFVSNTVTSLAIVHPSANHVYVSHGGGKNIDAYSIDRPTGLLKLVAGSTITTDTNPSSLVFSADGSFAYMSAAIGAIGGDSNGTITTFRVDDATGKLTQIGNTPAGSVPQALTLDTSGQFLYLNDNSNYLRVYKLQEDGTPKYVRSMQTRSGQLSIAMIPGDALATYTPTSIFVTTVGDNLITGYTVGSDGALTLGNAIGTPASPNAIALLPWGTHALVSASAAPMGSNLGSYLVDPLTGVVTYKSFLGDAAVAAGTAIDPGERYAFQSDSSAGVLRTYGRWPELGLNFWSLLSYSPGDGTFYSTFPAGAGAGPMAMVPSGRFVYVGNQTANSISTFNFWGELIESTSHYTGSYGDGSPYAIGAKPLALAADPMGMYLFVACDDKSLSVYSIDSFSGGHLKKVETVTLPVAATALGIDPSGHFLYVGDANGNVSPYSIDIATGSVSALTPSVLDSGVTAITVDSSGQFAYVLCKPQTVAGGNNGAIHALKVNPDGTVTELPVGPWPANNPSAIAFTDLVQ